MSVGFPAGNPGNTYVPSFDATGNLVVSYSRNVKDFAVNQYVTLTPVKFGTGYYLRITPENAARVLSTDLADFIWPDAHDAPTGEWNTESHEFEQYATFRYAFPFRLGYKAVDQAAWKIVAYHAAMAAQQAMTGRTVKVIKVLEDTTQVAASHTSTATATTGGLLTAGSPTNPVIKQAFNFMAIQIQKDTLGVVQPKDLVVVMSPETADPFGRTQEVHTYLKESPFALAQVRGDVKSQNGAWGLPDQLYGFKLSIEDCVRVTSRKGAASLTTGYAKSSNSLTMLARPGQLVGVEGAPSFSGIHVFAYEEMTAETKDDPDNRRTAGRVVEDNDVRMVSPVSVYIMTHILS
jgi:hypothetical protein